MREIPVRHCKPAEITVTPPDTAAQEGIRQRSGLAFSKDVDKLPALREAIARSDFP